MLFHVWLINHMEYIHENSLMAKLLAHLSTKCSSELLWSVNVCRAASTIAIKAYFYTPGPMDSKLGRKHLGVLYIKNS